MFIKELLPIGSVVVMQGGEKKIMIFGVRQSDLEKSENPIEYDYIGVMYPEGNMGVEFQFLFNHKDISEIIFRGYEDEERKDFIKKLDEYYLNPDK